MFFFTPAPHFVEKNGHQDMKGDEAVPLDFKMLPAALKEHAGYETHALGSPNIYLNAPSNRLVDGVVFFRQVESGQSGQRLHAHLPRLR